jgi:uncharacterized membrane protein YedE/YeeE
MLILNDLTPMNWAVAGAAIGVITLLLLWTTNRRLGISTSYENMCSLASSLPYFGRSELKGRGRWRLHFASGLLLGGVISAVTSGGWAPIWDLGMFDAVIGWGPAGKLLWMFAGGILIGLGTRMADGCTSGHGIFGLANFERASFQSVACFMLTGILTTNLIYRVIF